MRLEDYWGVGPKTAAQLRETIGEEAAIEAIDSANVRRLADAGVASGRVIRILRRANAGAAIDLLATTDARDVYDDILSLASDYALTRHAADRIRVLTPLSNRDAIEDRLDEVVAARDLWDGLDADERTALVAAFDAYDEANETERSAVETALTLREMGLTGGPFDVLADVDAEDLREASEALQYVTDDGVADGADEELDRLRADLADARELEHDAFGVLDRVREGGVYDLEDFKRAFVDHVVTETSLSAATVRAATPDRAQDAADYVSTTLRALVADLESAVERREATVRAELRGAVDDAREDVDAAVAAVDDAAFTLSLARFAAEYGLTRPSLDTDGLAVANARNLFVEGEVQPVTYAVGDHDLPSPDEPPSGDRVAILTGANSGGKTTLLETLCSVVLLASMGLPVPAERAEVGRFEALVFHRRHASFNAGVLESTLKNIVPPLADDRRTLVLVDEFEAITEPGRAADLLDGLVDLTVDRDALGVYVTHLAEDLAPRSDEVRVDGIFARGLTPDLELEVDYQPRFGTLGKSTPEFIVSRLVADATDRTERRGFESLAAAVGEEAVQRTLSDARWDA
ncbi:DNA mismatch repair protein [Haloplanus sp. GCM10025708]|uniref:DNA mismatch repair protein n=1 Tax=Haloferacaceae TaxID=1644056 RepID=UPI00361F9567